jgi:hypothetical protein
MTGREKHFLHFTHRKWGGKKTPNGGACPWYLSGQFHVEFLSR